MTDCDVVVVVVVDKLKTKEEKDRDIYKEISNRFLSLDEEKKNQRKIFSRGNQIKVNLSIVSFDILNENPNHFVSVRYSSIIDHMSNRINYFRSNKNTHTHHKSKSWKNIPC